MNQNLEACYALVTPPLPVTVANEGLVRNPLLRMVHNPCAHCYPGKGGQPKISQVMLNKHPVQPNGLGIWGKLSDGGNNMSAFARNCWAAVGWFNVGLLWVTNFQVVF